MSKFMWFLDNNDSLFVAFVAVKIFIVVLMVKFFEKGRKNG